MNQQHWKVEYKGACRCALVLDDSASTQRHLRFAYDAQADRGVSVWLSADSVPSKVTPVDVEPTWCAR